jgi:hypothetical protein
MILGLAAIFGIIIMLLPPAAEAQTSPTTCGQRSEIVKTLTGSRYNEQLMIEFSGHNGYKMDLYHNPKTGTWTIVGYILPNGVMACMLAVGVGINTNPHHEMPGVPM